MTVIVVSTSHLSMMSGSTRYYTKVLLKVMCCWNSSHNYEEIQVVLFPLFLPSKIRPKPTKGGNKPRPPTLSFCKIIPYTLTYWLFFWLSCQLKASLKKWCWMIIVYLDERKKVMQSIDTQIGSYHTYFNGKTSPFSMLTQKHVKFEQTYLCLTELKLPSMKSTDAVLYRCKACKCEVVTETKPEVFTCGWKVSSFTSLVKHTHCRWRVWHVLTDVVMCGAMTGY